LQVYFYMIRLRTQRWGAALLLVRATGTDHRQLGWTEACALRARAKLATSRDRRDAGYVAVDAMVALLIVALTVILSLTVAERAGRAAQLAQDTRQADSLLRDLLVSGPRSLQMVSGVTGGYQWSIETQITGADRPIEVCRRFVQIASPAPVRRYWASTMEPCPIASPT
jgi:hypothetical protein